jgi:hypothetical protein
MDGRIPDGYVSNTMKLMDYYETNPFSLPAGGVGNNNTVAGLGLILLIGQNSITNNASLSSVSPSTTVNRMVYGWVWYTVNNNGIINTSILTTKSGVKPCIILNSDGKIDSKLLNDLVDDNKTEDSNEEVDLTTSAWWTAGTVNYNSITGGTANNSYGFDTSIITSLRFLSAGMKVTPLIEVATTTSVNYVSKYYGCQMSPQDLKSCMDNSVPIVTMFKESPSYFEAYNAEGISGRLCPCQQGIIDFMQMQFIGNYNNTTFATDNMRFPNLLAMFTQPVTWTTSSVTLPINLTVRFELECVMRPPTPFIGSRPPFSSTFKECCNAFTYDTVRYPNISKAHTFKRLFNVARTIGSIPFVRQAAKAVINSNPITKSLYDTGGVIVKTAMASKRNQARNTMAQSLAQTELVDTIKGLKTKQQAKRAIRKLKRRARDYLAPTNRNANSNNMRTNISTRAGGDLARLIGRGQRQTAPFRNPSRMIRASRRPRRANIDY